MHIWTDSAVAWLPLQDEQPTWPRNPRPRSQAVNEEKKHA
jgi:hypothetical protein